VYKETRQILCYQMKRLLFSIVPVIASIAWFTTLVILFTLWVTNGEPKYKTTTPHISYISSIGAHFKTVFVIGGCITAVFFILGLLQFPFLHRTRNIPSSVLWYDVFALLFGIVSATALVLLTVFDSINHESFHWAMTLVFAITAIIVAILNLKAVAHSRTQGRSLRISFFMKTAFVTLGLIALICMIGLMVSCSATDQVLTPHCDTVHSISAVFEWSLGILFFIFLLTWVIDFSKN
jgi:hypothetical protein